MTTSTKRVCQTLFLVLSICATGLYAQVQATNGSIQGDITDPSGGLVPGAAVEADEVDTAAVHRAVTDDSGHFEFPSLLPGPYIVKISKTGFATTIQQNLILTVGRTISHKMELQVASDTESVIVTSTPSVDVVTTSSTTNLGELAVASTPVLGRKFEDSADADPGCEHFPGA
jgi:hypothetical protein